MATSASSSSTPIATVNTDTTPRAQVEVVVPDSESRKSGYGAMSILGLVSSPNTRQQNTMLEVQVSNSPIWMKSLHSLLMKILFRYQLIKFL